MPNLGKKNKKYKKLKKNSMELQMCLRETFRPILAPYNVRCTQIFSSPARAFSLLSDATLIPCCTKFGIWRETILSKIEILLAYLNNSNTARPRIIRAPPNEILLKFTLIFALE